jgi:hypothetical protein
MRKVVDSNMLQSDALREYLCNSSRNYVVLTDYSAMEAYKGDTLLSIYRSMEILATRPRQVIVLKGTQAICGLRGRASGLQRRMIDEHQTRGFEGYCRGLYAARNGDKKIEAQLLKHGREATAHLGRVLLDAKAMPYIFDDMAEAYTMAELKALRLSRSFTDQMGDKIMRNVLVVAASVFRDHPKVNKLPGWSELSNTFIFRFSLCAYLWALGWISVGGASRTKPERLRNDMVDVNFAAYATYFDGLLTADRKAAEIYRDAVALLRVLQSNRQLSRTVKS